MQRRIARRRDERGAQGRCAVGIAPELPIEIGQVHRCRCKVRAEAQRRLILGLGFLFRLQAWIVSGGNPFITLLKVDILNVMVV